MPKYYRGDVIEVIAPAGQDANGNNLVKPRPVVVWKNASGNDDIVVSVYCTSQNKGEEDKCIFIEKGTQESINMGLTKDTYIIPTKIINIPSISVRRKLGVCSKIQEMQKIVDKWVVTG